MTEYEHTIEENVGSLKLKEQHIYGSSRLGMKNCDREMIGAQTVTDIGTFSLVRGEKSYELSNHLGNVLEVITDQKLAIDSGNYIDYFQAEVISYTDYYPFGAPMDYGSASTDRNWQGDYRYGFNGKENDSQGLGGGQSTYDYGFRIYNAALGKFLSVDPLTKKYPELTTYQFASNRCIDGIDLDGLEFESTIWGTMASYSGFSLGDNQEQVGQAFTECMKTALKDPKTYETAALAAAQITVVVGGSIFLCEIGGTAFIDEALLEIDLTAEAVSTEVEIPVLENFGADAPEIPQLYRGGNSVEMSEADINNAVNSKTKIMKDNKGVSFNTNPEDPRVVNRLGGPHKVDMATVSPELKGKPSTRPGDTHYELVPKESGMPADKYQKLLNELRLEKYKPKSDLPGKGINNIPKKG